MSEVSNPRALLSGSLSRRIFANMLRRAFPADSDNACAERGAPVLGISPRHFRRLLQEECAASLPQVFAVMALNGFEIVARKFEPGDS